MTPEFLAVIGIKIEHGHRLLNSLYDSGDLSVDQYDGLASALLGATELRKFVEGIKIDQQLQASERKGNASNLAH